MTFCLAWRPIETHLDLVIVQTTTFMRMLPQYERLIPLEDSYDDTFSLLFIKNSESSNSEIHEELLKRRADTTNKFKEKWKQILEKYSAIDDDLESDELDLHTGRITKDNGHLRSMKERQIEIGGVIVNDDIWAEDDSYDKAYNDYRRVKAHQEKLKKRFDTHILQHNKDSSMKREDVPIDDLVSSIFSPSKRNSSKKTLTRKHSSSFESPENSSSPFRGSREESIFSSPLKIPTSPKENSPTKRRKDKILIQWYNCAFEDCPFKTELRAQYGEHLLAYHADELSFIGYPVDGDEKQIKNVITELCTRKLGLHYPLNIESDDESLTSSEKACPILGCRFDASTSSELLRRHIRNEHRNKIPRSSVPSKWCANRDSETAHVRTPLMASKMKVPDAPICEIEDDAESSSKGYDSLASLSKGERIGDTSKGGRDESGYDSIDEFFND